MAFSNQVTVGTTAEDLKDLLETAGDVFPNDNDSCEGLIIQIDPAESGTLEVLSTGSDYGIVLSTDSSIGPPSISYREFKIRNCSLKASVADTNARVFVERKGA